MNALANAKVGKFINRYFISSFQRVASFRIVNGRKQGGNVAVYFCTPDGLVLNVITGPVQANEFLDEAEWVVQRTRQAITKSKGDATKFKGLMRRYHADRLAEQYGLQVSPVLSDDAPQDMRTALAYRDRDGRHLGPVLPLPVIEKRSRSSSRRSNQAKVHRLLAAHACKKIEDLFGVIFEGILGEIITTKPVQADTPFPGRRE